MRFIFCGKRLINSGYHAKCIFFLFFHCIRTKPFCDKQNSINEEHVATVDEDVEQSSLL